MRHRVERRRAEASACHRSFVAVRWWLLVMSLVVGSLARVVPRGVQCFRVARMSDFNLKLI